MSAGKPESQSKRTKEMLREVADLKSRLAAVQETLKAIRKGDVDALAVSGREGDRIFTLCGEQEPYRIFVETMNEGAAMVAADGTIVYSNRRFADLVRTPLEKVIGSHFHQFASQEDCPILKALQEGEESAGYRHECALNAPDGVVVPVYLSARPMTAGGVRSLCIIATDITERKLAEERVLQSEQQFRLIFDQIPAAIWTTDKELRILSASGAGLTAVNLRAEDLVGKTVQGFLGTRNKQATPIAAHLAAVKGEHRSYETNFFGRIFTVDLQPLRGADGEITGVIAVALDVTENKKIQVSISKLAAIVESSQDAIYGTTLSGYITSWNPGAEKLYGYSAGEVMGQHVSIIVPNARNHEPANVLDKVKRGEILKPFETVRRCKDGSLIDVSITVSAVKDAMGRVTGISAIAHDLSDRKRVEKELRKLSGRLLKMQDEERRNMARDLHDSVIQGLAAAVINLSMLMDTAQLLPQARVTLEETLKITEDAVREIRTFSYLLHPPLLDVMGIQSALRWYVEGYRKRSGISVELDLADEGQDRIALEMELALFRIVQEALTNVHRHSGGRRATISMKREAGDLTLTVSDDGHGMDAETLAKVRREGAALGVGIAGMKERIRQLGGRLDISSGSQGTAVTVSLPIANREVN